MERAAYGQGNGFAGAAGGGEIDGAGDGDAVAADDDLVVGIDVGEFDAGFGADLVKGQFVQPEDGGHRAGAVGGCLVHQFAAPPDQSDGVGELEYPGGDQGGVFTEAVAGDGGGVAGLGAAGFAPGAPSGDAYGHDGRLGVHGVLEFAGGAFKYHSGQGEPQAVVRFLKGFAGGGGGLEQGGAHADFLRALPGEHVGPMASLCGNRICLLRRGVCRDF